jgi:hypothetical protein
LQILAEAMSSLQRARDRPSTKTECKKKPRPLRNS